GPKFLHYRPETLILTSVEHDHADLYATPAALEDAYRRLVELVPPDGRVIACGDSPDVRRVAAAARAPVLFYGLGADNDLHPLDGVESVAETAGGGPSGSRFRLADAGAAGDGTVEVVLPMAGEYNVANALAVWAAARGDGLPAATVAAAFGRFQGAARRQDELGTVGGVTVVDDFAHHPTAVAATLAGLARRYAGRRLVVCFEPRSLTAGRRFFQDAYAAAFAAADRLLLAPVHYAGRYPAEQLLDLPALAAAVAAQGAEAVACADVDEVLARAVDGAREGDVLITMSSGSFAGLPRRLLAALEGGFAAPSHT
ncbi:MAG TPA: Mur ligase family protein, partial [Thermoanaerobaculia bacterium]|nr:Mur ligase family protein [Thermoanaerobaculia bacterium]